MRQSRQRRKWTQEEIDRDWEEKSREAEQRQQAQKQQQQAQQAAADKKRREFEAVLDDHYQRRAMIVIGPMSVEEYVDAVDYLDRHYQQDILSIEHSHSYKYVGSSYGSGFTTLTYTALVRFYRPADMETP